MAQSPSHKFGQIIGNLVEDIMIPVLDEFCEARGLYLDTKGKRNGARKGRKVTWADKYGNDHDLDFVIEKGGTERDIGRPVAFIEAAWRRYTKHSRNKAQEIQGAILPIADKFRWDKPFLGVVVAGDFTEGSLNQLRSVGFRVLYFPYESIVAAFASIGINARFDENTPDDKFLQPIQQIENISDKKYRKLKKYLITDKADLFDEFLGKLGADLDRIIQRLVIVPLYGNEHEFECIAKALEFIDDAADIDGLGDFRKFEIIVRYSNGDGIDASFGSRDEVKRFLQYLGQ